MTIFATLALAAATLACTGDASETPAELGRVRWLRDHDVALARAKAESKPVFALFQEVPGCSTCVRFGAEPLSHPLLVEAIEELFVPLAVFNNRGGADGRARERYGEPAWNNPVVRFLDARDAERGRDLIPRRDGVWSTGAIATRAVDALRAAGSDAPAWLELVAVEESAETETAAFAMACFWQGEARLGALEGVIETNAGWLGGREAVTVRFDPRRIDRATLEREARDARCSPAEGTARAASETDHLYHLRRSRLRFLPLTPMQRTKVNAALGTDGEAERWLSPRQRALLARLRDAGTDMLEGLEPPGAVEGLPAYERALRERLGL